MGDLTYWLVPGGFTIGAAAIYKFPKYRMHMVVVALVGGGIFWYSREPEKTSYERIANETFRR